MLARISNRAFTGTAKGASSFPNLAITRKPPHQWRSKLNNGRVFLRCLVDMTSPPNYTYYPEVGVEDLDEYAPGGYHPTSIGDTFCDGRYTVFHKLGFGGHSTVWLARDHQSQRNVSLKIQIASSSGSSSESKILHSLQSGPPAHLGKEFVPRLFDQFTFGGSNGQHLCLVGEALGCSTSFSKEESVDFMFPAESASDTDLAVQGL